MIRVAVIGAGYWGPHFIRNFDDPPRSEVRWVIDRDRERLAHVQMRFDGPMVAEDPVAALTDPMVDAVVMATPTITHFSLARSALEAGKHVLVEKPIATSTSDAEELWRLADRAARVLAVGHVFLYNGGVQRVKAYLEAGDLGRVYYVAMVRTNLGPIRLDVNAAWDLASHDVSIANYWLGSPALAAAAIGGVWINPGIEDAIFATLRYPADVVVNLHVSWLNPRKVRDITVVGDRRMLTLDDMNLTEPIRIYDKQVMETRSRDEFVDSFAIFRSTLRDGDITIPKVSLGEPLRAECDDFLECIRTGKRPLSGGREAVDVVRTLEAMERSIRQGGREEPL